ncbi:origin recognition complex subunit 2-like [Oppia nitens]|uniref:origin recognition complex subunit 2-like n=1 Tax=Oppia nitens TaxID=1686743 RepID=UPI0023DB91F2|nr:origin recognition complex subunit 2-like [Oppia nitens]
MSPKKLSNKSLSSSSAAMNTKTTDSTSLSSPSPTKRVRSALVDNEDTDVTIIVDKSHLKMTAAADNDLVGDGLNNRHNTRDGCGGGNDGGGGGTSSDDDDDDVNKMLASTTTSTSATAAAIIADNYFMAQRRHQQRTKRSTTGADSDQMKNKSTSETMAKVMKDFDLTEDQIKVIVDRQSVAERKHLMDTYVNNNCFDDWMSQLCCGFNVLLYGLGSKRKLMETFAEKHLSDEHHIVINGYNNEASLRHIILVLSEVLDESIVDNNMKIIDKLNSIEFDLYLVIHSIDFLFATNPKIKSFIGQLVVPHRCSRIRIIASVDHINSGLIWSTTEANAYRWLWFNVPTLESYSVEKAFSTGLSMLTGSAKSWSQSLTYSSVKHVFDSLTTNAQKIFLLILQHFVDKDVSNTNNNNNNNGFPFADCYDLCREEMLVISETTLRAQISEFKDHRLLKSKKGCDGGEVIVVCLDKTVVQSFLDSHPNNDY